MTPVTSAKGVEMDSEKIKTVLEWDAPETVKDSDIQSFLGFANFYLRFSGLFWVNHSNPR